MSTSELNIHKTDRNAPKVQVTEYSDFFTVAIHAGDSPVVKFFLRSQQQVVNFKNNFLQAVERPTKIE